MFPIYTGRSLMGIMMLTSINIPTCTKDVIEGEHPKSALFVYLSVATEMLVLRACKRGWLFLSTMVPSGGRFRV